MKVKVQWDLMHDPHSGLPYHMYMAIVANPKTVGLCIRSHCAWSVVQGKPGITIDGVGAVCSWWSLAGLAAVAMFPELPQCEPFSNRDSTSTVSIISYGAHSGGSSLPAGTAASLVTYRGGSRWCTPMAGSTSVCPSATRGHLATHPITGMIRKRYKVICCGMTL